MKIEDRLDRIEAMLNTETWGDDVRDIAGRTLGNGAILNALLDHLGLDAEVDENEVVTLTPIDPAALVQADDA